MAPRAASGSPWTHADDERTREVGQAQGTDEVSEQGRATHALLVGIILHVLYAAPKQSKTLAGCAHLLSDPGCPIRDTLNIMLRTHHDPEKTMGWRDPYTGQRTPTHPAIAAAARAVLDMDPRTSSGVIATAQSHLDLFRDPAAASRNRDATAQLWNRASPHTSFILCAGAVPSIVAQSASAASWSALTVSTPVPIRPSGSRRQQRLPSS